MWKALSLKFCGFGLLLLADAAAIIVLHPGPLDLVFWVRMMISFGVFSGLAFLIARWLWRQSGVDAATIYLVSLTMLVMLGAALSTALQLGAPPTVYQWFRAISGIYLLYLWYAVVRFRRQQADRDAVTAK